jgi:hypothetical protein
MGKVILQAGTDKAVILAQRQRLVYPFVCPNWTDLQVGMFVSLTQNALDNDLTGLTETLAGSIGHPEGRVWIGLKDNSGTFPETAGTYFAGISSIEGNSYVVEQTTPNGNYWYVGSASFGGMALHAYNGVTPASTGSFGGMQMVQFPNTVSVGGGYCGYIGFRFTRSSAGATGVLMNVCYPSGAVSPNQSGTLFTSTPTLAGIRAAMRAGLFNSTEYHAGVTLATSTSLQAFFFYWPFLNSNLKIHALAIEKFA